MADIELRRALAVGALASARTRHWSEVDDRLLAQYGDAVRRHAGRRAA
jgi:hypothetical protein